MPIVSSWTDPSTGGLLDIQTGTMVDQTWVDRVLGNQLYLGGATGLWTTYTPTVTQGVGITITVNYARYMIVGKTAFVMTRIQLGSAGTAGNNIFLGGFPSAINPARSGQGSLSGIGWYLDSGVAFYTLIGEFPVNGSTMQFYSANTSGIFGVSPAVTIASPDQIAVNLTYELA